MTKQELFLSKFPVSTIADALHPLVITDMDSGGLPRDGLGWSELFDPTRVVSMSAKLPNVVRERDEVRLFWTPTEPATQPPQAPPAEEPVQCYPVDADTESRGWLSFGVVRDDLKLPPEEDIPYPYFGYFFYSLYDPDAQETRYSEYREVLIDLKVPGGLDPNPRSPANENLVAPIVTPSTIDSPNTPVSVTIEPWDFMQPDDQVTLVWNGARHVGNRLDAGDVDKPCVIDVPAELIREGGSGENLLVYYEIRDRVQNYSRPSPPAYVKVEDPNALEPPEVEGAENPPYTLDLVPWDGGDVTIYLPDYEGFAKGDRVTMHWVGLSAEADGKQVPYDWPARTINVTRDKIFTLPYLYAALVVNGLATVYYESTPGAGGNARPSRRRSIIIVGEGIELQPPVLLEAVDDEIDLASLNTEEVHVRVPVYPGQRAEDVVTLFWTGKVGNGGGMTWQTDLTVPVGGEQTELVFEVSLPFLSPLVDGTLTLSYSVHTPEFDIRRSSPEHVYNVVDSGAVNFPAPTCAQVEGNGAGASMPSDTENAIIDIPENASLRVNDEVTLRWEAASGGTPPAHTETKMFTGFPFNFTVSNEVIRSFEEVEVSVTYSVQRTAA